MRLGVVILPDRSWEVNLERWQAAEKLGFDSAWTYDHVSWRGLRDAAWFAAMPVLAAAAATTGQLRLGILVASPNFRHPVTLVKEAIAIDDISGGRFVLGVGAGSAGAGDAEVLGGPVLSPTERTGRFHEFVALTDQLLRAPRTTFRGRFYATRDARMIPGSTQQPRLPLAVAASGRQGLAVAARYGDAWVTPGPVDWLGEHTLDQCLAAVAEQARRLAWECDRAGRDYARLDRMFIATPMSGDPQRSAADCLRLAERAAEAGMTHLIIHWPREDGIYAGDPRVLADIAADVLPQVHRL